MDKYVKLVDKNCCGVPYAKNGDVFLVLEEHEDGEMQVCISKRHPRWWVCGDCCVPYTPTTPVSEGDIAF